ncbi:GNAT family N-acetyltransferase [Roseateles sp. SL47]|uniref:GNAT family N-acetyltransferase n=1 Tax=Roseateles sp. SL47 TaxID=2995138 RepID=UPI0022704FCF|nr:GNAT family N-acetyltransferase [Roseateles sp. SL47]WAC72842.1 GNAT family N-acetyltransferase [Roseateles sp. SL47]
MTSPLWRCELMEAMTPRALYRMMKLRSEVFVVEQQCIYLDPDGLDEDAWHLQALGEGSQLLAYARLLAPGAVDDSGAARIGRVLTAPAARGTGLGRPLMQEALAACARLWPASTIELGAQAHLRDFYGSFGFVAISDVYDEDGIPHIDMRREAAG